MPRLSADERGRALGRLEAGEPPSTVARVFGVHVTTINRLVMRFMMTNSSADRPRSGRPRVTNAREDRLIARNHRRNRLQTASGTARATIGTHGRAISRQTVSRRLSSFGLNCRRPYFGPVLTRRHRQNRLKRDNPGLELHRTYKEQFRTSGDVPPGT